MVHPSALLIGKAFDEAEITYNMNELSNGAAITTRIVSDDNTSGDLCFIVTSDGFITSKVLRLVKLPAQELVHCLVAVSVCNSDFKWVRCAIELEEDQSAFFISFIYDFSLSISDDDIDNVAKEFILVFQKAIPEYLKVINSAK